MPLHLEQNGSTVLRPKPVHLTERFTSVHFGESLGVMTSPASNPRDPLHGITLESIINQLVQRHGWSEMARRIPIRCFQFNPTVKSSLTFLRKTPWAREKVEDWFIGEKADG